MIVAGRIRPQSLTDRRIIRTAVIPLNRYGCSGLNDPDLERLGDVRGIVEDEFDRPLLLGCPVERDGSTSCSYEKNYYTQSS